MALESISTPAVKQLVADDYHRHLYDIYGDRYLSYRHKWTEASKFTINPSYPIQLDLELFNACNYKCSFCPYSYSPSDRPRGFDVKGSKTMSIELIRSILSQSNGHLYAVELGYNTEPLLHPNILDIIRLCKDNGVLDIRMGSNGSLLGNVDMEALIKSGLTQLQVSIDAVDEESYELSRNSNLYESVVSNVKKFVSLRDELGLTLPRLRVTYVMTAQNKKNSDLFLSQWENVADIIGLQDLLVYDTKSDNNETNHTDLTSTNPFAYDSCYMPNVRLSIRSDGTVHPCCTVPGMQLKVGDANKQSIQDIWNSPAMVKIRQSHQSGEWRSNLVCKSCIENMYT